MFRKQADSNQHDRKVEGFGQPGDRDDSGESIKLDEVYLNDYESMREARQRIGLFIEQYNSIMLHASLEGLTPNMVYFGTKDMDQAI